MQQRFIEGDLKMNQFKLLRERDGRYSLVLKKLVVKKNIPPKKAQNLKRKTDQQLSTLYGVSAKW